MNFNSIRFKYTGMFSVIAVVFIISVFLYSALITKTERGMTQVGEVFNIAISAVLNADRDLYQARVAELQIINAKQSDTNFDKNKQDFEENAQQALQRMQSYQDLMVDYPSVLAKLNSFNGAYNTWLRNARQVFELVQQGEVERAKKLSQSNSLDSFNALREFYNVAGENADRASSELSNSIIKSVGRTSISLMIFSVFIVCLTLAVGILGPKSLSSLILALSNEIKGLNSGDGDLTRRIQSKRRDEIGQLANDFDEFVGGLANLIGSIIAQSKTVIAGVETLDTGATSVQKTSQQQTEKVETIVTAVNEMSYAIKEVAQNAVSTSDEIEAVNQRTMEGSAVTEETVCEMEKLSDTINESANIIGKLAENSNNIASVLDVIRSIAEQTNLLALNAAIEAARAGEQGRGFAVVADEVRSLASRTQESTQSIQDMIESLQSGVEQAVTSINLGNQATVSTANLAKQTLTSLNSIATACEKVSNMATQTATATEQQALVAQDISKNLTELSDHTKDNYDTALDNGKQANNTMALAKQLSDSVLRFRTK